MPVLISIRRRCRHPARCHCAACGELLRTYALRGAHVYRLTTRTGRRWCLRFGQWSRCPVPLALRIVFERSGIAVVLDLLIFEYLLATPPRRLVTSQVDTAPKLCLRPLLAVEMFEGDRDVGRARPFPLDGHHVAVESVRGVSQVDAGEDLGELGYAPRRDEPPRQVLAVDLVRDEVVPALSAEEEEGAPEGRCGLLDLFEERHEGAVTRRRPSPYP